MLATFVIGLREGLEAALIVGIIAAFLRKNNTGLRAMWLGVALAVILSVAVGVGLHLVEQALPQARQEGMEAAIGCLAVVFVTGMIFWMNRYAAGMKRSLEAEAAQALGRGSAYALAGMAFLAVLREGFETSVFLLATFSAAQSAFTAAAGAVIGLLVAVVIGWGIYAGGVRINLSRFFRVTGLFLILVAAGLVITSLRAAHEAGWLNAGQQSTVDLSWLVAPGTVQSALITGVLGIPADPRRIEMIGWLAYLIPVTLCVLWPASRRPTPRLAAWLRLAIAAALGMVALALATLYPNPHTQLVPQVPLVTGRASAGSPAGTAQLSPASDGSPVLTVSLDGARATALPLSDKAGRPTEHDGVAALVWVFTDTSFPSNIQPDLTLDQVAALAGGRIPVGLSRARNPGPFAADWSITHSTRVWIADGVLLDAADRAVVVVTLSGGGLQTPRSFSVSDGAIPRPVAGWWVSPAYRDHAIAGVNALAAARDQHGFWARQVPVALAAVALLLAAFAGRTLIRLRCDPEAVTSTSTPGSDRQPVGPHQGARNAAT
ncbi:MAG: FTR1 family protein [Proteobacteria bacterium]|nr:FTR1 family protein [Pseudomonadota bacterium]